MKKIICWNFYTSLYGSRLLYKYSLQWGKRSYKLFQNSVLWEGVKVWFCLFDTKRIDIKKIWENDLWKIVWYWSRNEAFWER